MRVYKLYSYASISLVRYSVLILNKVAMPNWNVDHKVDFITLLSTASVFDPTTDTPPDYSVLSPFANDGG